MNVKPGDLAIVIKGKSTGKICIVESSDGISYGEQMWNLRFQAVVEAKGGFITNPRCRDSWLRPVSGLPDDEVIDEREPIKEHA